MEAVLKKEVIANKQLCRVIGISTFIVLIALGAFVRINLAFSPVPITLQTMFVLLAGALLGSHLGGITLISYIILGVLGLPVFSGAASGIAYLFSPTAGYLVGFILAAVFLGNSIKYAKNNLISVFFLFCLADFILLICGVVWLKILFGYNINKLLFIGLVPFIPGDLIKAAVASVVYFNLKARVKEIL
ncbi:MAG: biotin transporter BioY [Candidatus Omnitrophota bacterium]